MDRHDEVVAQVRESLPEFCRRNNVTLDEERLDNLARWVVNSIPPGLFKRGCSPWPWEEGGGDLIACACTGHCQRWERLPARTY